MPLVARNLRELRLERGMSIRELAETSNVPKGLLSLIERGMLVADRRYADALAAALELEPGSLVTRTMLVHEESQ
jgi:transcriptional regulator with XRE-family HTH domain